MSCALFNSTPRLIEHIYSVAVGHYTTQNCGSFGADRTQVNMAILPKTYWTFSKTWGEHQSHNVAQFEKGTGAPFALRKWHCDKKQGGYGGRSKPIFQEKAQTTEKFVIHLPFHQQGNGMLRLLFTSVGLQVRLFGRNKLEPSSQSPTWGKFKH